MRTFGLIILIFLFPIAYAQDPGTAVELTLSVDGRKLSGNDLENYQVEMFDPGDPINGQTYPIKLKHDSPDTYRQFAWKPYYGEVYGIRIIHRKDTMEIRMRMDLKGMDLKGEEYVWNSLFKLDVPFASGYFEVVDFVKDTWIIYKPTKAHSWEQIPIDKRKLYQ